MLMLLTRILLILMSITAPEDLGVWRVPLSVGSPQIGGGAVTEGGEAQLFGGRKRGGDAVRGGWITSGLVGSLAGK